jgi:lysophospholipase L1-like esterase
MIKNTAFIIYVVLVVFVGLEIFLRFYNPIPLRVKGDKIILTSNRKFIMNNDKIPVLDKVIVHTKNSLGFRGQEKPLNFDEYLSIITVGGSTTEVSLISDHATWQSRLERLLDKNFRNIWINNAGMDGHSTFGHKILLEDHLIKIKPKIILFYVGINEATKHLNRFDVIGLRNNNLLMKMYRNSEVLSLGVNIYRYFKAQKMNVTHKYLDLREGKSNYLYLSDEFIDGELKKLNEYLEDYEKRLEDLIHICKINNIDPILMTQPLLLGYGFDDVTGTDLEKVKLDEYCNGKLQWVKLQSFNDITMKVAHRNEVFLIDLANKLPKSSLYFYDGVHYTNEGCSRIGEIVASELTKYLSVKYFDFWRSK